MFKLLIKHLSKLLMVDKYAEATTFHKNQRMKTYHVVDGVVDSLHYLFVPFLFVFFLVKYVINVHCSKE